MRILVTGGAGFIGSHVSEQLLRHHHSVSIVDDLNDFYSPQEKHNNLTMIRQAGPVSFYQADICDAEAVGRIFREVRPEVVIHLAARAGVRPSLERPLLYEKVNVNGTLVLLEASREAGTGKFLFASSSSVYGIANHVPFNEDDHVNRPISPYAATKLAGEHLCYTYSHLYGMPVVCLRFFTVYGPRQRPDLAIHKFTTMIECGNAIPVFGDGTSGRDYTFVDDIVQGVLAALAYHCKFEVFNLGNSHPVDLKTVIATIERLLGKTAVLQTLPVQPGDVPITYADISKARALLGYDPATSFPDGVEHFIEWVRSRHQVPGILANE
jgi:UDP-glucuronate 4-epimerase